MDSVSGYGGGASFGIQATVHGGTMETLLVSRVFSIRRVPSNVQPSS